MLPSVAPFPSLQPHHHMSHYHAPGNLNSSYGFNSSAFPSLTRNDPSENSLQSIPRTRLQYPHPVQRLDLHDTATSGSNPAAVGEHALRRKTPNGTLSAGYDGTPGDTTIQPPASKHILVSSLEAGQIISPQTGFPIENWQQPVLDQSSRPKPSNFPPVYSKNDASRGGLVAGDLTQDANGTGWVRSLNYDPGMDSVLNQNLPMQQPSQRFYLHDGAYVPTVLPATLQPCVGPTASAGSGPYGPYWPDGVYIPYRPAALRDSRFSSPAPFAKPNVQFYDSSSMPPGNLPDAGLVWNQAPLGMLNLDPTVKGNFPPRYSEQKPLESVPSQQVLPNHTRQNTAPYPSHPPSNQPFAPWANGPNVQQPGFNSRTTNVEFKEKALSWAHGVYVDLLASIHQARRNSITNNSGDVQDQRLLKPSIYPKPPRQPGLDFSQPSRHHFQQPYGASDMQMIDRLRQAGRFTATGRVSRFRSNPFNENPGANAVSALETLSHLCIESGWEWIDGMLLGGCLAYGLGDYHKAIRWYSRIIARDTT